MNPASPESHSHSVEAGAELAPATWRRALLWGAPANAGGGFRTQTSLVWLVLILFAGGRFFEFFLRSDSPELALGLSNAQWTSLVLLVVSTLGWIYTARRFRLRQSASLGTT